MERIGLEQFRERADEYDAVVSACGDLDRFCSSSDWIIPAHEGLMPPREAVVFRDTGSWIALARGTDRRGVAYLEPMEASWGLACPVAGAGPRALLEVCRAQAPWDVMLLGGVFDRTTTQAALLRALIDRYEVRRGDVITRHVADLRGGLDAYLGRRTRNFRRSLNRARRRAAAAGIEIEICDGRDPRSSFARLLDVERRSWKGRTGVGIEAGGMREFYSMMIRRLAHRGGLRLRFARRDCVDVAYILGGIFAGTYRGLQFSFDDDYAQIGLGNVLQHDQMAALCAEGAFVYDLGTTGGHYKLRWTDRTVDSTLFYVIDR